MSTTATKRNIFNFGEFTLDLDRGALLFAGEAVKLRPKSFDVLRHLVTNAGRLVSKDELLKAVWGQTVVTDDSLTQCLIDIRKAMGDQSRHMIQTVPRRGYIFDVPVSDGQHSIDSAAPTRPARQLSALILAVIVAVGIWWVVSQGDTEPTAAVSVEGAAPPNSIAVLPFLNMSSNNDQQYMSDGISEEILNLLAQTDLQVIARTSSFSIRTENADIATIARRLNVAHVVEGSVRKSGDDIRISVQIINGESGLAIWSQSYERDTQDLVAVQQEIANAIVEQIVPGADEALRALSPTTRNVSGHELMLLARHYEQLVRDEPEVDEQTLMNAIALYRDATVADPQSALAQSRLAGALLYARDITGAEAPIFKALTINPNLSEVQDTLGKYYWARGLPGAGAAWLRAVELNPNNADALASYAYWFWQQGNDDGPEPLFRRALELDPLSLSRYGDLGAFLGMEGRVGETLEIARRVEELFEDAAAFRLIARLLELTGNVDQSIAWTIRARDLQPENPVYGWQLAELYAEIGDFDTALKLQPEPGVGLLYRMRRYEELIDTGEFLMIEEPNDIMLRYLLAFAYNATGEFAAAVRILRSTGLPDIILFGEWKQAINMEAYIMLIDATVAVGDRELAYELAEFFDSHKHSENPDWWIQANRACVYANLDRDAEALERLERIKVSARLPWYPMLRDSPCFQRYADNPRYLDVIHYIESRQAELRERLPATLKSFGVAL